KSLKDQELIKPNPSTSVKTTPSSEWTIPLPSKEKDPNRLSKDVVKAELKKRKIEY
ncbi:6783_t:CDS:2, partial [Entrophospora sp. SA101]